MKLLEYPFDAGDILRRKRKIRRELLEKGEPFLEKKVAVLGGSTTKEIINILELFLLNYGIKPQFYESEYNQYYEEAVFPNSKLAAFEPDIIYLCTTNRNIMAYPAITDTPDAVKDLLRAEQEKFEGIWKNLNMRYHCPIIQNNFEMPLWRLLGNRDASDIHGAVNFITRLNLQFYEYAQTHDDFYICDLNYISADYGLKEWLDPLYYYLYKYALNVEAIPYLAFNVANIIKSIFGKNKKGFVLDLDQTLWGGIIGEDGAEAIKIGPEDPEGEAFYEFQKYIKVHKQLGIVLTVDSKNDPKNAVAGLSHPDSELSCEDFAVIKANWEPKDRNLAEIASALNLLPESLVFIDDNPVERHLVSNQIPGVAVPEIGESHQYIQNIDRNGYFEVTTLSEDDYQRTEMYQKNAERARMRESFAEYGDYLRSLEMKATIRPFELFYLERIAQLTNKSNQFNLTTRRYTKQELKQILEDPDYITLYGKLRDRFGDNGVVSVVIGHKTGTSCCIDLWLMSCRVLKRDMELAMMDALVHKCQREGITHLYGDYYPTEKNNMVRDFYALREFEKVSEDEYGNTKWVFEIKDSYEEKNRYIRMEE